MKNKVALGLTALIMGLGGNAMAAEQVGTAQVNKNVLPSCKMNVLTNIPLVYNPSVETVRVRNIFVRCTKTTSYEIGVSNGSGESEYARVLKFGENTLSYNIDWGMGGVSHIWGDIGSANTIKSFGTGVQQTISFTFNIPASQYVAAGSYVDDLVVTFNY